MSYKMADFFAGVGGIRLGFAMVSPRFECVFSNDIDKHAVQTYETNFAPDKVETKSITELDPSSIPDFDIFLGGFPCQPFSIAGKQEGFQDTRGNIFFDIVRILKAKKPKVIFLENVKNLATHDKGNTLKVISKALLDCGYSFRYKVLNSCRHGDVPQNRERIFIVGFQDEKKAEKFRFPTETKPTITVPMLLEEKVADKYYYTKKSAIYPTLLQSVTKSIETNTVYQYRRHYVRENQSGVCPTLTANMGGGGHNVPIIKDELGLRKLTPRETFNLQGFPSNYILPENLSDTQLYKQAGNSVTVKVIRRIAENILKTLDGRTVRGDSGTLVKQP